MRVCVYKEKEKEKHGNKNHKFLSVSSQHISRIQQVKLKSLVEQIKNC